MTNKEKEIITRLCKAFIFYLENLSRFSADQNKTIVELIEILIKPTVPTSYIRIIGFIESILEEIKTQASRPKDTL